MTDLNLTHHTEIDLGIRTGIGDKILFFPLIDSTNSFLKANAHYYPEGIVVWGDSQTSGRGRHSRKWESPEGKGLYFSILLKPNLSRNITLLSLMTSLALKSGIEEYAGESYLPPQLIDIKWPNDLIISGRKIAGILIEGTSNDEEISLIVGIGLNITARPDDFSDEVARNAGALEQFYGGSWNRKQLLKHILLCFGSSYCGFNAGEILNEYRQASRIWGRKCYVDTVEGRIIGICKDLSPQGELIVETSSGEKKIIAGTLHLEW